MRELVDADRVQQFMHAVGRAAEAEGVCYLVGGATAVLFGWRRTTVDLDIKLEPEQDAVLRALPGLKNKLRVNVELASPGDFIPLPEGWEERSPFVTREGSVTFRHFDLYAQALAKLERAHDRDREDVQAMIDRGLVEPERLRELFEEIRPGLYRFPAIDERRFAAAVRAL
jgi:hypothetical protein